MLLLSSVSLGACYVQSGPIPPPQPVAVAPAPPDPQPAVVAEAQPVVEAQPVAEAAPEYYYGGAHLYPLALGGEWCPIAEPPVHDFPPDHPEYYAYDNGYYYYAGRPGEVYVVGRAPVGVRVHVVREGESHGMAGGFHPQRRDRIWSTVVTRRVKGTQRLSTPLRRAVRWSPTKPSNGEPSPAMRSRRSHNARSHTQQTGTR